MRHALIDLRALRHGADFRRLWWTQTVAVLGAQLMLFAVLLQVWQMTGSPLWTGAVGLAHAVPMIAVSLVSGALADSGDRRRLVLLGTLGQLAFAVLLAGQALLGNDSVLLVLALVSAQTVFAALAAPARRTFVPRLLPAGLVPGGLALSHISGQGAMLVGPAVGGLLAAGVGVTWCYLLHAVGLAVSAYGVVKLPSMPPELLVERDPLGPGAARLALGRVVEGLRYVVRRPVLRGSFLTDLSATLLVMPVALFPMVNEERFGGSPQTLGLFMSAVAIGGVGVSLLSGTYTRAQRQGVVMLSAASVWCVALTCFAVVDGLVLTMATLVVAGAADTVSVVARGTITQLATPDALRGRVASAELMVGMAGPDLGNARGGAVAAATSSTFALASGGLLGLVGVLAVAWRLPAVRRFTVAEAVPLGR